MQLAAILAPGLMRH